MLGTNSLGKACKLFYHNQWNSSSWTDVPDIGTLIRLFKDPVSNKSRIENQSLSIRFSFGRAKSGMEFKDQADFEEYTEIIDGAGDCLLYSKNKYACSPYIRRFGATKRNKNWGKPTQITKLISNLYTTSGCKLHFGFMREHSHSFFRIISANIAHYKDASPFHPFVEDPSNIPSDTIIDEHLLSVFIASF